MSKPKLTLLVIVILGFFLRTYNLPSSPPGFNADEAALGYNAYSIIHTGKDEWGETLPLVFKSFSDYKPGLYVYLDIPFVALMGLNELSVRLPSILLGALSIGLIYLLSKELFASEIAALSAALLLAISPWHIHYSRGAWETNVATFFITLGIYTFIKGMRQNKWLIVSVISLILSMYTYQSPRLIVPALVILLALTNFKKLFVLRNAKLAVVGAVLIIPLGLILVNNKGLARFNGLSIFNDPGPGLRVNQDRGQHDDQNSFEAKFFHNKYEAYAINFLGHYLDHFSPNFLFISGDPLGRNKVPEMGQMYIFEIVTVLIGLAVLLKGRYQFGSVVLIWLLIAPLAASLTYQTPHALRDHNMVIPMILISGLGLGWIISWFQRSRTVVRWPLALLSVFISLFLVFRFFDLYFVHLPKEYALEWEYGFSQVMDYVRVNYSKYNQIYITDRYDQPYILTLFYMNFDPATYQQMPKKSEDTQYGFSTIRSFDKFHFGPIPKDQIKNSTDSLFIGTEDEIGGLGNTKEIVRFPNGLTAFKIVDNEK